jgi:hypothetical protein
MKNTKLKEFVDFAFSLKEMKEVTEKGFPIPTEIVFKLNKVTHESLQKEVLKEKNLPLTDFSDEFDVEIYNINFKFISK